MKRYIHLIDGRLMEGDSKTLELASKRNIYVKASDCDALVDECICKGNWRTIVKETEHLIGKQFHDSTGEVYTFFGIVHGDDDYYYGMCNKSGVRLLSCVGSIEGHGFTIVKED